MLSPRIAFLYLTPFLAITSTNAAPQATVYASASSLTSCRQSPTTTKPLSSPGTNTVNLRIEGENKTIYEGPITSGPRNITLPEYQNGPDAPFPCNGLNNRANPTPGNTPTDALDAAAKASGFTYDGHMEGEFSDFDITSISTTSDDEVGDKFWGNLVNYQYSTHAEGVEALTLTGCQQEVKAGDEVLWAYITLPANSNDEDDFGLFLKLAPTAVTVKKGKGFVVTVTDGRTGVAVKNASVDGVHTDASGKATLYLFDPGFFHFKAHQTGNVRSNVMNVTVTS